LRGRNRSLKARARRRCLAFALEREASVGQSRRIVRVEARRLVEVGDGAVVIMLIEPGEAAIEEGHSIAGIEPQRLTEIRDGAFVLPARTQRAATPDVSIGMLRIETDRLAVVCKRARQLALAPESIAAGHVAGGCCRIETNRFVTIGERAIGIARGDMRRAPVAIELGQRAALRAGRGDQPIASCDRLRPGGALACGCIIGRGRRGLCLGQERESGDELNEAGHENLTKLQKLAIKIAT
jgi:hypothetical protein